MLSQDELTFRLCEDISIKLCDFFASKSEKNNLIDSIVTYIRENYKNPALCLSKISDEFHISESYFSHMFKENMNVNFSVYLEDLRLTEAAHLIEKGESGINEIALVEKTFDMYQKGVTLLRSANDSIDRIEKQVKVLDDEGFLS